MGQISEMLKQRLIHMKNESEQIQQDLEDLALQTRELLDEIEEYPEFS